MKIQNKLFGCLILFIATLCGIVTKQYKRPSDLQSQHLFRGVDSNDTLSIADIPWEKLFEDPVLQTLIKTGLENNYDLKIGMARMQSATANLEQSKLAFFSFISADVNISRIKNSSATTQSSSINTLYEY